MRQAGDTLIEVILGITIFSLVAVGALTLMNSGLSIAQRSLETTLVRQQIDAQAELLRYVSHSDTPTALALWANIKSDYAVNGLPKTVLNTDTCPQPTSLQRPFALRLSGASLSLVSQSAMTSSPETYAKVVHDGSSLGSQGISIQLVRVGGSSNTYDAYIQACWEGPGASRPMTIGTIARIYDTGA